MSASYKASTGSENCVSVADVAADPTRFTETRCSVIDGLTVTVGKYCERPSFTSARAWRNWASACAIVWLDTSDAGFERIELRIAVPVPPLAAVRGVLRLRR